MQALEDERARGDSSIAKAEVLNAEHRADRRARDEVVDDAGLIAIDEQMTDVVSLDDREQSPKCPYERLSAANRVVAQRELGIRFEKRRQSLESPFADGRDVRRHQLAGICGHLILQAPIRALEIIKLTLEIVK